MENAPTIRLIARKVQPEYEERFLRWQLEVYLPLLITIDEVREIGFYEILRNNPQYPQQLQILHYRNRNAQINLRKNQKYIDVTKDVTTTWRARIEPIWMGAYQLVKSYRNTREISKENVILEDYNKLVMHIEGYNVLPAETETYEAWLAKWGNDVFVPVMMKLPGLIQYDWFRLIDVDMIGVPAYLVPKRQVEYPAYLNILTFGTSETYDNYEKSPELAAFRYALRVISPKGLVYKWYVQYQLVKSWRK